MGSEQFKCEICGVEARVHVTNDVSAPGQLSHYCLRCADADDLRGIKSRRSRSRSAVVMALGFIMLMISLLADYLRLGVTEGLGLREIILLAISAMLIGVGAIMRASAVLIVGIAVSLLTLLADQLALGDTPGFGMQQRAGATIGFLVILIGFFAFRKARKITAESERAVRHSATASENPK